MSQSFGKDISELSWRVFLAAPILAGVVAAASTCGRSVAAAEQAPSERPQSAQNRKAALQRRSRIRSEQPRVELPTTKPPAVWDSATLDVFFIDARAHLGPGRPRSLIAPEPKLAESIAPAASTESAQTAGWSKLISRDTLEDEVKQLLAEINRDVQSPGAFKSGGFQPARLHFTLLAALFNVIAQYDGEVRWKQNAGGWADLFGRAGRNCKAGSDASFKEAKLRAADLAELVRGDDVQPTGAAGSSEQWSERVDRRPLMSRLEISQQERFGSWTANKAEFGKRQADLQHEAELLAVVAEIIQRAGYEFAEDESYQAFAREFQTNAITLRKAAANGDYPQARSAVSQINQSCEKCHADYRS